MISEFKVTGGGRIGRFSASWPLVKLSVTANRLEINASIGGKYVFAPDDVISIEPARGIRPGVKITHRVTNYSSEVIFSSYNNNTVLDGINQAGFTPGKSISALEKLEIVQLQESGGFAFKLKPIIAIIVIWNVIIIGGIAMFASNGQNGFPALPIQCANGFMVLVCVGMLINQSFAEIILKPGRSVRDVRSSLLFIMFICGFMFLVTTLTSSNLAH